MSDSNTRIEESESSALPLGKSAMIGYQTRFELATAGSTNQGSTNWATDTMNRREYRIRTCGSEDRHVSTVMQ